MFKKILIANRGEIAVRIIRACRELGITSAALYSDADVSALHARYADEAYHIGNSPPSESYLDFDKIINLAKQIHADAIHPGYGFLSERSEFIRAVEESGITFIGPSSKSVELMGSKTAARRLMQSNGVPIVPGTIFAINAIEDIKQIAQTIGYPVLLKASSGGGGKGMKKVTCEEELEDAFTSAQREAKKAFGDDAVYIEKFVDNPKHIEVQIIADKQGSCIHLFERECSVQRRHQKVVEEAPSPLLDPETRERITTAAINAAKACGYYNAGTIEFLMDQNNNFYFLEMNTRLQVEHPVTEFISGFDIVKEQISIAWGNPLSVSQNDLSIRGHAIEARVYAEDPANGFLPSIGKITFHRLPSGPGIRSDEGIDTNTEVSVYYDPLLTKISVWASSRNAAIARLKSALADYHISGVQTNIPFLIWILNQPVFQSGKYSINFLEEEYIPLPQEQKMTIPERIGNDSGSSVAEAAALFSAEQRFSSKKSGHAESGSIQSVSQKQASQNAWTELRHE